MILLLFYFFFYSISILFLFYSYSIYSILYLSKSNLFLFFMHSIVFLSINNFQTQHQQLSDSALTISSNSCKITIINIGVYIRKFLLISILFFNFTSNTTFYSPSFQDFKSPSNSSAAFVLASRYPILWTKVCNPLTISFEKNCRVLLLKNLQHTTV